MSASELVRAIRGPILLITLGVLLAVDQLGPYGFSRTWPVLIIVLGVLKLLEKTADRPPAYPPAGPGGMS
jgi:hypothetical protein